MNGARGEVHIVTNNSDDVTSVLVKFDNSRVGLKSIQTSSPELDLLMVYF